MWSKSSSEIVKAKMLYNYLEDCQKKELHEIREKKKFPSRFSWIGKKFRKRFTLRTLFYRNKMTRYLLTTTGAKHLLQSRCRFLSDAIL